MTITNEDNMQLMARYEDNHFDLAIVDPPYRDENQPTKDMRNNGSMKSLEGRPSQEYFNELYRVSKNQIIWGANNFQLPQFKGFFVWDKGIPFDFTMSMVEIASLSEGIGTISKLWKFRIAGAENRIHPTQKPVTLYEKLLMTYAKEGDKILDTHLGSGSIAIACHNLGYDLTACELDKDYYKASLKRINQHKAQLRII
jgi:site-specific DNA-methyltransferase (adenine-specific)